jgi:hypothetical protein
MLSKRLLPAFFLIIITILFQNCPSPIDAGKITTPPVPTNPPQAPGIPLVSAVLQTSDMKPKWTWSETADALHYRYLLDTEIEWNTVEAVVTSFVPESDLSDGNHTLYVQAGNSAGWSASGSATVSIDTSKPAAPMVVLDPSSDSGVSDTDGYTNIATVTLNGSGLINCTLILTIDGTDVPDTIFIMTGAWTRNITLAANQSHTITARIRNSLGSESFYSVPLVVVEDQDEPVAPSLPDLASLDDSGDNADNITNNDTDLTFSGSAESNAAITLRDGGSVIGTTNTDSGGSWTLDTNLSEGIHNIFARATDLAGNESSDSAALEVIIDKTSPAVPGSLDLDNDDDTGTVGDHITSMSSGLTLTGTREAYSSVVLSDTKDGTLCEIALDASTTWSMDVSLTSGDHYITGTATDKAGNASSASQSLHITVISDKPNVPTALYLDAVDDTGVSGDNVTYYKSNLTIHGHADPNMTIKVYSDRETGVLGTSSSGTGDWSLDINVTAEGAHNITATATDVAYNTSNSSNLLVMTIDSARPAVPLITDLSDTDDSGRSQTDNITNTMSGLTFTGNAEQNSSVRLFSGPSLVGSAFANGSGIWIMNADLAEGTHDLYAIAIDLAGNESDSSSYFTVEIDNTAPATPANLTLDSSDDTGMYDNDRITRNTTNLTLSGIAETNCIIDLSDGGGTIATFNSGSGSWSRDISLAEGTSLIVAKAADVAGNESNNSAAITITVDNTMPDVLSTVPADSTSGVAVNLPVTATFSESMDTSTISPTSFTLSGTTGSVSHNAQTKTAVFTPAANLSPNTQYTATITTIVRDIAGNQIASVNTWTFTTTDRTDPVVNVTIDAGTVISLTPTGTYPQAEPPSIVPGKGGDGIDFTGDDQFLMLPNAPENQLAGNGGSVECWIYPTAISTGQGIIHKGVTTDWSDESYSLQYWLTSGGYVQIAIILNKTPGNYLAVISNYVIGNNAWYHIVATWDTTTTSIYVNGTLAASAPSNGYVPIYNSNAGVLIGKQIPDQSSGYYSEYGFKGTISYIHLYDRAMNAQEALDHYNATK